MKRALILFLLAASCIAQQQEQQHRNVTGSRATPVAAEGATSPEQLQANRAKARDLLQLAEAEARGLEPGMRALTLQQIGSAYVGVDQKKAAALLHDAFTATTEIDPDRSSDASMLQESILEALLGLDAESIPELLPRAQPRARSRIRGRLIGRAAQKKDFALASELVNQAAADDAPFPYEGVTTFLLALPPDASAERLNAFMQAYTAYSRSPNTAWFSNSGFDRLIVRFGPLLPKDIVLKAIDEVLNRAKDTDDEAKFTLSSSAGSASFNTQYDYYLFELLPVLRRFDPARADDLLQKNTQLQGAISKYPNGVSSMDPTIRDTPAKPGESSGLGFSVSSSKGGRGSGGPNSGSTITSAPDIQQVIGQYNAQIAKIQEQAGKDARQALSQARSLPEVVGPMMVRANALEGIARSTWRRDPVVAHEALDELVKTLENAKPDQRARLLRTPADLYLNLKDNESAARVIRLGIKTAEALYEIDNNADDPNKAIKGYWPSAAMFAQCVTLAYKVDPDSIPEILAGIKDDEIRTAIRVAYAMALTGNTPNSITTMVSRKGGTSMNTNSSN